MKAYLLFILFLNINSIVDAQNPHQVHYHQALKDLLQLPAAAGKDPHPLWNPYRYMNMQDIEAYAIWRITPKTENYQDEKFYNYVILSDGTAGTFQEFVAKIIYVGKGSGKRVGNHVGNVIGSINSQPDNQILAFHLNEAWTPADVDGKPVAFVIFNLEESEKFSYASEAAIIWLFGEQNISPRGRDIRTKGQIAMHQLANKNLEENHRLIEDLGEQRWAEFSKRNLVKAFLTYKDAEKLKITFHES